MKTEFIFLTMADEEKTEVLVNMGTVLFMTENEKNIGHGIEFTKTTKLEFINSWFGFSVTETLEEIKLKLECLD